MWRQESPCLHTDKPDKGRTCAACHDVDRAPAQTHPELVQVRRMESPLKFQLTLTGGRCSPGCHTPQEYDREVPRRSILLAPLQPGEAPALRYHPLRRVRRESPRGRSDAHCDPGQLVKHARRKELMRARIARWGGAVVIAPIVVLAVWGGRSRPAIADGDEKPSYVGAASCKKCHSNNTSRGPRLKWPRASTRSRRARPRMPR